MALPTKRPVYDTRTPAHWLLSILAQRQGLAESVYHEVRETANVFGCPSHSHMVDDHEGSVARALNVMMRREGTAEYAMMTELERRINKVIRDFAAEGQAVLNG
jgi:hypothetical protein